MKFRTRFAPSPTGPLHLGHAFSALSAFDMARAANGEFLLRIEDIDQSRARLEWEEQIYDDLSWLGLTWEVPVMRQSDRMRDYDAALGQLAQDGLIYPCSCNRADIETATSAPQEGVVGPDGPVYPGTCRPPNVAKSTRVPAYRLHMGAAVAKLRNSGANLSFQEDGFGPDPKPIDVTLDCLESEVGDVVLARRDFKTSYHLAVVIDDAAQGISHVIRGRDLFDATRIHVLLQHLLNLPTPIYHHHDLIRDENGKRLAKRDDARAIAKFRQDGLTAEDIRGLVGLKSSSAP